jgi:hypothetical protein
MFQNGCLGVLVYFGNWQLAVFGKRRTNQNLFEHLDAHHIDNTKGALTPHERTHA